MPDEHWKKTPDEHDYPATHAYLGLLIEPKTAKAVAKALQDAPLQTAKAKDLLRASQLPLLPTDDAEVRKDLTKADDGEKSSVLLVRGELGAGRSPSLTATTASARATTSATTPTSPTEWSTCPRAHAPLTVARFVLPD